jgi:hypothetical protein
MLVKYSPWRHGEEVWGVKIEEGQFNETVISINSIDLSDESNDVAIDFNFLSTTPGTDPERNDKDAFDGILAPIIEDIIHKAVQHYQEHEARNTDTQ